MLKVYLAAPYSMKTTIEARAAELAARGIHVTSSWLQEPHSPNTQMHELTHEEHVAYAIQDVKDVAEADIFVFHTDPTKSIVRAGRHVEFGIAVGIALSRFMPIFVVGDEYENIFHHLPQVLHFPNWEATLSVLTKYQECLTRLPL
jgi:nucleoside 2-deoxyribosyltransferase